MVLFLFPILLVPARISSCMYFRSSRYEKRRPCSWWSTPSPSRVRRGMNPMNWECPSFVTTEHGQLLDPLRGWTKKPFWMLKRLEETHQAHQNVYRGTNWSPPSIWGPYLYNHVQNRPGGVSIYSPEKRCFGVSMNHPNSKCWVMLYQSFDLYLSMCNPGQSRDW